MAAGPSRPNEAAFFLASPSGRTDLEAIEHIARNPIGKRAFEADYRRATILPVGVIIRPPKTSWIKPSWTSRAMRPLGIVRLRKPFAISQRDVNSMDVRSDCVGILVMAITARSFVGRISFGEYGVPRIYARRCERSAAAPESFHEALCPARSFLCLAVRIARFCLPGIDLSLAGGKQFLGRIPALAVNAAQLKIFLLLEFNVQLVLASRASADSRAMGSIVTKRVMPPGSAQHITVDSRR